MSTDYSPIFQAAAQQYNLDPDFLRAVSMQESKLNPAAVSPKGAAGLMGLMPPTAKDMGVSNILDPQQNIMGGAKYLRQMIDKYGNLDDALSAYNWGPGNFDKYKAGQIKQMPNETVQYPDLVSGYFSQIKQNAGFVPGQVPQQDLQADTGSDDPILAALSGKSAPQAAAAPAAAADDPIMAALSGKATGAPGPQTPAPANPSPQQLSFLDRFGQGVRDPLDAGAQLLAHAVPDGIANAVNSATGYVNNLPVIGPVTKALGMTPATPGQIDQGIQTREQQYQAARKAAGQTGVDFARVTGNVVGSAPLAALAPETAGMGILGNAAVGAGMGAANGALTPVTEGADFWKQKGGQIAMGAGTGAVAAPIASALGNAVAGFGGAAQRKLADAGVTMTPGQILGGGFARTEDKLTSIPVLGDLIKNAQQRSVQSFNRATYNEVLSPLGQTYSGPVGSEGVKAVQQTIGAAYDNALSKMTFRATDPMFQQDITNLAQMAKGLPPAQQQAFTNVLQTQIFGKLGPQGMMDGQALKGAQSELSRIARGYGGDASFDNRQLGAAIGEIKNAVDASIQRYNAPEAVQGLAKANAAWANFARLRGAAASTGAMNNGGVFTAAQLNSAVRSADKSVGKGATATGNALMQDFATAGQNVLGSKYPDSGTAGRSILGLLAGAAAGHAFLPAEAAIPAAIGAGVAALPYSAIGQRLAQNLLMSRPAGAQALAEGVRRFGVPLAPAAATSLLNGANR
ncbi:transglycosylase SLT domain-containing protein [Ralstonia sp. 3N]|uniref:transglycosylase SLT domain-containing protein n=1 Tax=Ralstonia sp. 3N TaxID=2675750 RepID=UPI0026573A33|nr:transglycosylase SLT domain-containing protein [Ralstonia sp. 3N]